MAIEYNNTINPNDIINGFTQTVVNTILEDAYDINNPPMDGTHYCIEQDRLGDKNSIIIPEVGVSGGVINALNLYNTLVSITTTLTRVGTFSYVRTYRTTTTICSTTTEGSRHEVETISVAYETSGTAVFNESYVKTLSSFTNNDIVNNAVISATGIKTLFTNLARAWQNTNKHKNTIKIADCHSDCNCYTGTCYTTTNCYK